MWADERPVIARRPSKNRVAVRRCVWNISASPQARQTPAMSRLEDLTPNTSIRGILPNGLVTVVNVQWHGSAALEPTYSLIHCQHGARSASIRQECQPAETGDNLVQEFESLSSKICLLV